MDFDTAFTTLTGHTPLPWQRRLYLEFFAGRLPTELDLPTGLGKTSVIAIWLLARAAGADVPRRLVYVVDRRAVVDQATEIADRISGVLSAEATGTPGAIRQGLGLVAGESLAVSTLRGQFTDNRAWLASPAHPAIIVGTVDMVGSRLLFQGYGVGSKMRSVHAALLGSDALVVLDEAHLVPPFEDLLRSITAWPRSEGIPPFRLLSLSATGRSEGKAPFRLGPEDLNDARTSARLRATKRLKVEDFSGELPEALAQRAMDLAGASARILVFCNSRKIAQKTAERLGVLCRAKFGRDAPRPSLLVGARRVWERAQLAKDPVFTSFQPNAAAEARPAGPVFLVATSAGEVGVDLDADHLVMDLVPWERMVQRLGRVNRRAEPGESLVDVFAAIPDKDAESGADRRGDDVPRWRAPFDAAEWGKGADGRRDASPLSLLQLRSSPDFVTLSKRASSPEPFHPDLALPDLDAWSMTSLEEHPGRPDVAAWLRGWIDDEPQTRVLWRIHFPVRAGDLERFISKKAMTDLKEFFEDAPPHLSETLEAPTSQVADVLKKRAQAWGKKQHSNSEVAIDVPIVVVLDSRDGVRAARTVSQLERMDSKDLFRLIAGQTVVVDARLGGLDAEGLLDDKSANPPRTLDADDSEGHPWTALAGFRVYVTNRDAPADDAWPTESRFDLSNEEDDEEGRELRIDVLRSTGSLRGDAAISRMPQGLDEHHDWTAEAARKLARHLRLPPQFEAVLVSAAAVHDAGKARTLWQDAMRAPRDGRPFAKTRGGGDYRALLVDGSTYRHEFGSLGDAEFMPAFDTMAADMRDLALHLIASHHGYARPVIAPLDPEMPPSVAVERARSAALRFHRMHRRWGPWGLAWWEALLRAADWAASKAANERGATGR